MTIISYNPQNYETQERIICPRPSEMLSINNLDYKFFKTVIRQKLSNYLKNKHEKSMYNMYKLNDVSKSHLSKTM